MENLFRNLVYTGVGFVALTKKKFEEAVETLVTEEKISSKEGKKLVDEFVKNTESKVSEFEGQMKNVVEKVVKSLSFATTTDLDALRNRVAVLEAVLASKLKEDAK
ncbi:MAG: hypothetical protein RIS47_750 [Bacteroidota bacterium]|jgi:polyhydroxyalkanoate synthesis regulator phasin